MSISPLAGKPAPQSLLVDVPKAGIPDEKQKELAMALMELLIQAAQERDAGAANGGGDEREADR